jgi:hypothetical protein
MWVDVSCEKHLERRWRTYLSLDEILRRDIDSDREGLSQADSGQNRRNPDIIGLNTHIMPETP